MAALSGEATESCGFKMASAEGGPGDGELWQTWLPNHAVFLRLREGLKSQSSAETKKPASSLPSSPPLPPQLLTRNLVLGLGGELFLWDPEDSSFLVVRLRGPSGVGEEPSLSQYQVRPGRIGKRPLASVFVPFASWLFFVCWVGGVLCEHKQTSFWGVPSSEWRSLLFSFALPRPRSLWKPLFPYFIPSTNVH